MITIFGIHNCDTVKKTQKWLSEQSIDFQYHDFRKDGITENQIRGWLQQVPVEKLLNKRSTTWKQLSDSEKTQAETDAIGSLLFQHPTLIKRPVIETGSTIWVGFNESQLLTLKQQD